MYFYGSDRHRFKLVGFRLGSRGIFRLAKFDNSESFFKSPRNLRQLAAKRFQQCLFPAVADSHPNQSSSIAGTVGKMQKILILADHNPIPICGVIPNLNIGCFCEL